MEKASITHIEALSHLLLPNNNTNHNNNTLSNPNLTFLNGNKPLQSHHYKRSQSMKKLYPSLKQAISSEAPEYFGSKNTLVFNSRTHEVAKMDSYHDYPHHDQHHHDYHEPRHDHFSHRRPSFRPPLSKSIDLPPLHKKYDPNAEQNFHIKEGFISKGLYTNGSTHKIYNSLIDQDRVYKAPETYIKEKDRYHELYLEAHRQAKWFHKLKTPITLLLDGNHPQAKYRKHLRNNGNEFPKEPCQISRCDYASRISAKSLNDSINMPVAYKSSGRSTVLVEEEVEGRYSERKSMLEDSEPRIKNDNIRINSYRSPRKIIENSSIISPSTDNLTKKRYNHKHRKYILKAIQPRDKDQNEEKDKEEDRAKVKMKYNHQELDDSLKDIKEIDIFEKRLEKNLLLENASPEISRKRHRNAYRMPFKSLEF